MQQMYLRLAIIILSLGAIFDMAGCGAQTTHETRYKSAQTTANSELEKVFNLCKSFADGNGSALMVKFGMESLTFDQLKELSELQDGAYTFATCLAEGQVSEESRETIEKYLELLGSGGLSLKNDCPTMINALIDPTRSKEESTLWVNKTIATVIGFCPEQVNNLKKLDESFDPEKFNQVADFFNSAKTEDIVAKFDAGNLNNWLAWASEPANRAPSKPIFKSLYDNAPTSKQRLRNALFEVVYTEPDLKDRLVALNIQKNRTKTWLMELDDLGLKAGLNTDNYNFITKDKTKLAGPLLSVLVKWAIRENNDEAYDALHDYAYEIKNALAGGYADYIGLDLGTWTPTPNGIYDILNKALSAPTKPTDDRIFINYYLALDDPGQPALRDLNLRDLYAAADRNETDVTNEMLARFYNLVIKDNQKAIDLSIYPKPNPGTSFLQRLINRRIDNSSYLILEKFINSLSFDPISNSNVAGKTEVLDALQYNDGGKNSILLLIDNIRTPGDDPAFRDKAVAELLKYDVLDPGLSGNFSTLVGISNGGVENLASQAFFNRFSTGPADFKDFYEKLSDGNKKVMRSRLLLTGVNTGHFELQGLIDNIVEPADPWGLRLGIANDTDEYQLPAFASNVLIRLLTERAIANKGDREYLKYLRSNAQAIRTVVANYYDDITKSMNPAVNQALTGLKAALTLDHRQDFAPYYLDLEKPEDVNNATARLKTDVTNLMVKELYGLVVGDDKALATELGNITVPTNFMHALLLRTIDKDLNDILGRYFDALGDPALEQNQLAKTNGGGQTIFAVFLNAARVGDTLVQKRLLFRRLTKNLTDPLRFTGVTPVDIETNVEVIAGYPEAFKKVYTLFVPTNPMAIAMRNALLNFNYDKGAKAVTQLITDIADSVNNIWGLNAGMASDIYTLKRNPAPPPTIAGYLLYVLAQRAMDESLLIGSNAWDDFRGFALIIKNSLGNVNYGNLVNDATPVVGQTNPGESTSALLLRVLPANQHIFINARLGLESTNDVYLAAGMPEAVLSNAQLKDLYLQLIGTDLQKASDLGAIANVGEDAFITRLMKRTADNQTKTILQKFLEARFAKDNAAGEQGQLNNAHNGAAYPIKILMDAGRLNADDPTYKADMIARLLDNDDDTASATLLPADLEVQKFFSAMRGSIPFAALYLKFATQNAKLLALRKGLLNDAMNNPDGFLDVAKLLGQMRDPANPWALRDAFEEDFNINQNVPPATFDGKLLKILTQRAIQEADLAANDAQKAKIYTGLRACAQEIRERLQENGVGSYVTFAEANAPNDAITLLKAKLDPTKPGHAEYYLILDRTYLAFNENLLMGAVAIPNIDFNKILWLFLNIITDGAQATTLASLADANNNTFLHLLLRQEAGDFNTDTGKIVTDYITKLVAAAQNVNTEIAKQNLTGEDVLWLLVDDTRWTKIQKGTRHDNVGELQRTILLLSNNSPLAINLIDTLAEANHLLDAIRKMGKETNLQHAFNNFNNAFVNLFTEWSIQQIKTPNLASFPLDKVVSQFTTEYKRRAPPEQAQIRRTIIEQVGKQPAVRTLFDFAGRIVELKYLLNIGDITYQQAIFPDLNGHNSTYLYAVLLEFAEARRSGKIAPTGMDEFDPAEIIRELRKNFFGPTAAVDWQNYLQNNINGAPPGQSILYLLTTDNLAFPALFNNEAKAKLWFKF